MKKAIALLGLPGAGKTYWGKLLAAHYHVSFYDLDELIVSETGLSIHEIFAEGGELAFRDIESSVLDAMSRQALHEKFVLSMGGGTPAYNNNMSKANISFKTIYIHEDIENIVKRLMSDKNQNRPLVNQCNESALRQYIIALLNEREQFYKQANYMLFSHELSIPNFEIIIND